MMTTTTTDIVAIYEKYAEERDKRVRAEGLGQYVRAADVFSDADPYMPVVDREAKTDHVTFAFIGGGFAGLLSAARVKETGIDDVRVIDRAGDFGGVWYWNRYPGAMCDTSSFVYLPLLEETGHMPTEKYAHGPEIREHCQRIGKHYDLYKDSLFHTGVTSVDWDDTSSVWRIRTDRGDDFTAQFVGIGVGPLHVAKLPAIPGIEDFGGRSFHTTRWDYDYTGGSPEGDLMTGLADKRVAVIGTGATALQVVPELAKACGDLFVVQRTPTSVDRRDNGPVDPDWFAEMASEPGWQKGLLDNFTTNWDGYLADPTNRVEIEDLVGDGFTELGRRIRAALLDIPEGELSPERMMQAIGETDLAKMEAIRSRVDEVVEDKDTAERLKAWYSQLCKRPGFHDEYLESFNRSSVHLVDTDGKGVERITETGIVVDGQEIEVDCIIYSTGFEYLTDYATRTGFSLTGRDGVTLADHWSEGMRTLHGMHVHHFPNLFLVQMLQAAFLGANVPSNYTDSARTIAAVISKVVNAGLSREEVSAEAEEAWVQMLLSQGQPFGSTDCTPGYYNNEGKEPEQKDRYNAGYPGGSSAFFALAEQWRSNGTFEGLDLA